MIGALVVLYIWAVGLIAFGLVFSYVAWRYFKKAKEYHKVQEDLLKATEIKTKKEYNKIATLPFKEFTDFLVVAFISTTFTYPSCDRCYIPLLLDYGRGHTSVLEVPVCFLAPAFMGSTHMYGFGEHNDHDVVFLMLSENHVGNIECRYE